MGSSLGPRFGSGLGSGSARARDYFSRALFGLGSVQGPDRGWLKVGARLRDSTRLGLAWLRLGKSLSFVRRRLGSKLGSARISFDLGSLLVACLEA